MIQALAKLLQATHEPTEAQISHGWYAMPGGRLELRSTGFYIERCGRPDCQPFHLVDPAGRPLASSFLLQPLKLYAEQAARDHAEFTR